MKRALVLIFSISFLTIFTGLRSTAQSDDVYYDPGKENVYQNNDQGNGNNQGNNSSDRDGYKNYSLKGSKSYVDSNGNTYVTNNYYEDNYYSTQLHRFYDPYCGFG